MAVHGNLINGEWVTGADVNPRRQPVQPAGGRRRVRARRRGAGPGGDRRAARRPSRPGRAGIGRSAPTSSTARGTDPAPRRRSSGTLLSREEGKTLPEGIGEAKRAGYIFKFFAGEVVRQDGQLLDSVRPGVSVEITREPIGVVGHHHALELPARDPCLEDRARARLRQLRRLQAGGSGAGLRLGARGHPPAGRRAGRGVQPRAWGADRPSARRSIGPTDVDGVSFTGSVETGRAIAKKVVAPHGQDPARDGRQEPAGRPRRRRPGAWRVNCAVQGAYYSTGQRCTASSRLIVTEGIHDRFVRRDGRAARRSWSSTTRSGRGTEIGPVVDQGQLDQDLVLPRDRAAGRARGSPGAASASGASTDGYYMAPALFTEHHRTRCGSTARRSSGRSRRSFASGTTTRRSCSPTTRRSGSSPGSSPPRSSTRATSSGTRRRGW